MRAASLAKALRGTENLSRSGAMAASPRQLPITSTGGGHLVSFTKAGEWQRLEVSHDAHRPGATLAVEILAPTLTGGTSLLVDDLAIHATSSSMSMR